MSIKCIVSVYNPNDSTLENITGFSKQCDKILVCDNSNNDNINLFRDVVNCIYINNKKNLGISKAFNNAIFTYQYLFRDDDYLIFFDQDSQIGEGHVRSLIVEYEHLQKENYKIGCIGPFFYNSSNQKVESPRAFKRVNKNSITVKSIITSSMVCRYKDLKKIGFWNENIFLDFADWDLCWRFREAGYLCVMTDKVILFHSIGEGEKKIGPLKLRIGKPFREYYQTRDSLYLLKEKYIPLSYKLRLISIVTIRPILHYLFLDNKELRIQYIKKGIRDFKNGIMGEIEL